jgi:hypothetical protein
MFVIVGFLSECAPTIDGSYEEDVKGRWSIEEEEALKPVQSL